MIPVQLQEEVADLEKVGYQIRLNEVGNKIYIQFDNYQLPKDGYTSDVTTLIVWTGIQYPRCAFDMFWVDSNLLLADGRVPYTAEHIESHMGKEWRRFSIHPYQHKQWNPNEDNLRAYLVYVDQRLNHLS